MVDALCVRGRGAEGVYGCVPEQEAGRRGTMGTIPVFISWHNSGTAVAAQPTIRVGGEWRRSEYELVG